MSWNVKNDMFPREGANGGQGLDFPLILAALCRRSRPPPPPAHPSLLSVSSKTAADGQMTASSMNWGPPSPRRPSAHQARGREGEGGGTDLGDEPPRRPALRHQALRAQRVGCVQHTDRRRRRRSRLRGGIPRWPGWLEETGGETRPLFPTPPPAAVAVTVADALASENDPGKVPSPTDPHLSAPVPGKSALGTLGRFGPHPHSAMCPHSSKRQQCTWIRDQPRGLNSSHTLRNNQGCRELRSPPPRGPRSNGRDASGIRRRNAGAIASQRGLG